MKRETLHWGASILKQLFEKLDNTSGNRDNNFSLTAIGHVVFLDLALTENGPFLYRSFLHFLAEMFICSENTEMSLILNCKISLIEKYQNNLSTK